MECVSSIRCQFSAQCHIFVTLLLLAVQQAKNLKREDLGVDYMGKLFPTHLTWRINSTKNQMSDTIRTCILCQSSVGYFQPDVGIRKDHVSLPTFCICQTLIYLTVRHSKYHLIEDNCSWIFGQIYVFVG